MWGRPSRKRSGPAGQAGQRCACGASPTALGGTPVEHASLRAMTQIPLAMSRTLAFGVKRFLQPVACTGGQGVSGARVAWRL